MSARRMALAAAALSLLTAGPAYAAADLVPVLTGVDDGSFGVRNEGDSASAPGQLTVVCEAIAGPPDCPEAAGMAAYENPAFPNAATISVPALEAGETFDHLFAFWLDLTFTPGTYRFTLMADAGNATAEDDELNNGGEADKVVLFSTAVGGDGNRIGKLRLKTAPAVVPGRMKALAAPQLQPATLVAGLPNLVATSLGFIVGGGPVAWGGSAVIDNASHVAEFQHGIHGDVCLLNQAAYRIHNASPYNAGVFKNAVFRGGKRVHGHAVAGLDGHQSADWKEFKLPLKEGHNVIRVSLDDHKQVSESDEANTYQIDVTVNLDCDGDGKVGGRPVRGIGGFKAEAEAAKAGQRELIIGDRHTGPKKQTGTTAHIAVPVVKKPQLRQRRN